MRLDQIESICRHTCNIYDDFSDKVEYIVGKGEIVGSPFPTMFTETFPRLIFTILSHRVIEG